MATILLLSTLTADPWGGSEELWAETAKRLISRGHNVRVCVQAWPDVPAKVQELVALGADVYFRKHYRSLARRALNKIGRKFLPGFIPGAIDTWFRHAEPDLVFISMGNYVEDSTWLRYFKDRGLAYAVLPHVVGEHSMPDDRSSAMWAELYEGARMTYCVCQRGAENLRRQLATSMPNVKVVRNPINVRRDSKVPWPDDSVTRIAIVGRLDSPCKGQDIMLQVMALPKWRERRIRLSIYGNGPFEQTLKRQALMLGLENVAFEGFTIDVEGIWARNHLLALPSRIEGLPLVLVEAMHMARPCVVTDVHGNAELVTEGETGFIASAAVANYFDEALERAWSRRSEWEAIGLKARESILKVIPEDPAGVFADELLALVG